MWRPVHAALYFVEGRAAVTHRKLGGVRVRAATSGWVAATFVHRTSRAGDLQLYARLRGDPDLVRRDGVVWVALIASAPGVIGPNRAVHVS